MSLTNPSIVLPPSGCQTVSLSTTTNATAGFSDGTGRWYSFRAVGATAYIEFGVTGLATVSTTAMWEIPAGQREDYYVPDSPKTTRFRYRGSATGRLKYRASGG